MNARALEHRITRRLMQSRNGHDGFAPGLLCGRGRHDRGAPGIAERVIAVLAATAAVFVLGSFLQELLWVLVAAATALALGTTSR